MKKFTWLLRREIWERRSLWLVPLLLASALLVLAGFSLLRTGTVDINMGSAEELNQLRSQLAGPRLDGVAALVLLGIGGPFLIAGFVMQALYALEAVSGERKDRSILFWRSLPVSDREALLAKCVVALVVIPAFALAGALVTQVGIVAMASLGSHALYGVGAHLWSGAAWLDYAEVVLAVIACGVVWNAPLVAASLLISAMVRSPVFFATLFPLALGMVERITLGTHHVTGFIMDRTFGLLPRLFGDGSSLSYDIVVDGKTLTLPHAVSSLIHPLSFLAMPEAWLGFVAAIPLLLAAALMRGMRDVGELRDVILQYLRPRGFGAR